MKKRVSFLVSAFVAGLSAASLMLAPTQALAIPILNNSVDLDNWGSPTGSLPITLAFCNTSAGCPATLNPNVPATDTVTTNDILPGGSVGDPIIGPVTRVVTVKKSSSSTNPTGLVSTDIEAAAFNPDTGRGLVFHTDSEVYGQAVLTYTFNAFFPSDRSLLALQVVKNGGSDFIVEAYSKVAGSSQFDQYIGKVDVDSGIPEEYRIHLDPNTAIDGIRLVYNPLNPHAGNSGPAVGVINAELCCVGAAIPEPSTIPLLLTGLPALWLSRPRKASNAKSYPV